ncbi:1-acyl-sn-glycerol-3-phosphate acyltransferase [Candidatus Saccharibacteria bacterium]|nr:1-acyl-sn-glycerol-3-phosphate acyltransferase [Candidatus Saccharibacteria bacterium]
MNQEVRYYQSFDQDFEETRNQDCKIPKNYKWIHRNPIYRFFAFILYILVLIMDFVYMKLVGHITVKNRSLLIKAKLKGGYYIFSNHTILFGDVVNPFCIAFPTHPYIICSPSNLGIPVAGKMLPMAGAIPIPDNIHDLAKFNQTVKTRLKQGKAIVTYPEGHLWPYYTKIRPFAPAAFHLPVKYPAPVYVATSTFQKSRFHKKPKITIYLDGPFYVDEELSKKQAQKQLHYEVQKTMERRSKHSTFEYIIYRKKSS